MYIPNEEEFQKVCDQRFSKDMYKLLKGSSVAIAGLGGLGSNIAVMLARSGIGKLLLVDFDTVELSNLNRQVYDVRHIGMKKTEALASRLKEINPYIELETLDIKISEEQVYDIFYQYKYVCEAFDKAETKAMFVNSLLEKCKNTTVISGSGMAGYHDANNICTRKLGRRLYICGDNKSDIEDGIGLMAPRVAICAGHEANKVIELILKDKNIGGMENE
ncbi:sulfur carrier protein ThiS adenylyltransferase [Hathewaya proteolytica DSM 3090]|uniref:Sulfur carrier protein ThiS adenylyltransferase n=1 Tax=Hathewaya proteolytica DSM 3090 TaxID=1121331 RepID=A0A1M6K3Y8_9CLOT|nr:sulfur carrier protein ThiS adenylyltransferase ThiF [Hathewaya proteolytica]SHJ53658.1 sulfur carrier protein ThiS adenylyltransferase [Hathewaya proteolytica DSM 3090]